MHPIIIIGTGFAGYELATQFRKLDSTTPLILITQDNGDFYSKPMLSKALTDKKTADDLATKTAEQMAEQLNATILTYTDVVEIDTKNKIIHTQRCDESLLYKQSPDSIKALSFSKLVLACGAHVKKQPFEQILHVNNLQDYRQFRQAIANKQHITIIGAGLVGCEFANDLTNVGYKVDVISTDSSLIAKLIPPRISDLLKEILEKQGTTFHLNNSIKHFEKIGEQFHVTLDDGKSFTTDLIFCAVGLSSNIDLAKLAGIKTNVGILTNQYLQTNVADIFALGDCAEIAGFHLKYIGPIRQCAPALAKTLTGELTSVTYPSMRVNIKTTSYKISVCPPLLDPAGEWKIEIDPDNSAKALHYDSSGKLNGFIVTHNRYQEHFALEKEMPVWLDHTSTPHQPNNFPA